MLKKEQSLPSRCHAPPHTKGCELCGLGPFSAGHPTEQPQAEGRSEQRASGVVPDTPEALGQKHIGWHPHIFPTSFYIWACPL